MDHLPWDVPKKNMSHLSWNGRMERKEYNLINQSTIQILGRPFWNSARYDDDVCLIGYTFLFYFYYKLFSIQRGPCMSTSQLFNMYFFFLTTNNLWAKIQSKSIVITPISHKGRHFHYKVGWIYHPLFYKAKNKIKSCYDLILTWFQG